jgi:hypothetical protein
MKKMSFGISEKKALTGAHLYVALFQIISLLSAVYIFIGSGYTALIGTRNAVTVFFETGIGFVPRAESCLLFLLYRAFLSEVAVFYGLVVTALILGIVSNKLLSAGYKTARNTRVVFLVLIIADITVRFLPFSFNTALPLYANVVALVLRLLCVILIVLDFIFEKKTKKA